MIKTLCVTEELEHYIQLGHTHTGKGVFMELGCWLGSSTEAILKGLPATTPLHVFDSFIWTDALDWYHGPKAPVHIGRSFLHVTLANLRYDPRLRPYVVDLSQVFDWQQPIETLIMDAAKGIETYNGIITSFYPQLLEGGYVFDQDFRFGPACHFYQKLGYYFLRDYLKPVRIVGNGVGFSVIKTMNKDIVEQVKGQIYNNVPVRVMETVLKHFKEWL